MQMANEFVVDFAQGLFFLRVEAVGNERAHEVFVARMQLAEHRLVADARAVFLNGFGERNGIDNPMLGNGINGFAVELVECF